VIGLRVGCPGYGAMAKCKLMGELGGTSPSRCEFSTISISDRAIVIDEVEDS